MAPKAAETGPLETCKRRAMLDYLNTAFVTMLVTRDPPGLAPVFIGLTLGMTKAEQREVALRGTTGNIVLTRMLGVVLAALVVQFVINGALMAGK